MDKAKAAVSSFISKSGQHDTEVHESVAPAVKHETINPHQREERQIALDREVHQDHYHATVQPVHDKEVLPEQHHHNVVPVEHRTHDKRDDDETQSRLQATKAQFKDESVRTSTQHHSTEMPSVAGEHVHHHIHETIQPVIHKETVEPHVMHTTVPIHEVHHNKAQHHAATALPAMGIEEFKKSGGALGGREERVDHFKGEPKHLEHSLAGGSGGLRDSGISSDSGVGTHGAGHHGTGLTGNTSSTSTSHVTPESLSNSRGAATTSDHTGARSAVSGMTGAPGNTGAGLTASNKTGGDFGEFGHRHDGQHPSRVEQNLPGQGNTTTGGLGAGAGPGLGKTGSGSSGHKPSLMDKLNPMKDADGDGKKGFMK